MNQCQCRFGGLAGGGGDGGHGVAVKQHLVSGQDLVAEVVFPGRGAAVGPWKTRRNGGKIIAGDHRHDSWQGFGLARVDAFNAGVGVWAAHEVAEDHAGQFHVVDEIALATDEARIFLALARGADAAEGRFALLERQFCCVIHYSAASCWAFN